MARVVHAQGASLFPGRLLPSLIYRAAIPQMGNTAPWLVLVWSNRFRVVPLRVSLDLSADVLR